MRKIPLAGLALASLLGSTTAAWAAVLESPADGATLLPIINRYTDALAYGLPNGLTWQVEGWAYDTLYEVEIANVLRQDGSTRAYHYPVFIERDDIEE